MRWARRPQTRFAQTLPFDHSVVSARAAAAGVGNSVGFAGRRRRATGPGDEHQGDAEQAARATRHRALELAADPQGRGGLATAPGSPGDRRLGGRGRRQLASASATSDHPWALDVRLRELWQETGPSRSSLRPWPDRPSTRNGPSATSHLLERGGVTGSVLERPLTACSGRERSSCPWRSPSYLGDRHARPWPP